MSELRSTALLTDLYQFTMMQAYFEHGMDDTAVFELFVRKLPAERAFLIAAGLEQALDFLEHLHFEPDELDWVRRNSLFSREFADHLAQLRFTGDVHAVPEGTIFFPNEPILRITAPLPQAQLVESRLINLLHFETLVASKAARTVLMAPGKLLVDFGMRRAHGAEAALLAARASYLAGFTGTATVIAGKEFGIPVFGTMAHSFIEAHDREALAFERFLDVQSANTTLLIDTYDTEEGARKVVALASKLAERNIRINAVRLDSGDLAKHAYAVRRILDEGDFQDIRIFSSGNLDEFVVRDLLASGAPIDGFGVGTSMVTSADSPYLDCAYKLQEYAGRPRRKRSEGKATWPGRKQIYRHVDADGVMTGDTVTIEGDLQTGEMLVQPVMKAGRRIAAAESLETIRHRVAAELRRLPATLRTLEAKPDYPVTIAPVLQELARGVDLDLMHN